MHDLWRITQGKALVAPYVVKHFAGIPVGIIGAVTRDTPLMVTPTGVAGLSFGDEADSVNRAADELRAGNVYINRSITGALVGCQPFGGYGLSGVGSKAGGPDYLSQFVEPRVITENTIRQGFAPLEE